MPRPVLIVLGSGNFSPDAGLKGREVRNPSGYALWNGKEAVLFDLGFGNLRQMCRAGVDPARVTHAFFSHRHPDHVGDLPALLFHFRHHTPPCGSVVRVFGPRGFRGFVQRLMKAHHPWMAARGYGLEVGELEEKGAVSGRGWTVRCREVPHSTEALAFRYDSKPASFCYSGDTGFDKGLASFARGVDLFALECTLADGERVENHLHVSEALQLFAASGARRGLLTHLSPASARQLSRKRPRRVLVASDLLRIPLSR